MALSLVRKVLTQGVGRRIFSLFLLAAILPMFITASLSYFEFRRSLENEAAKALKNTAKEYGVRILGRLDQAAERSAEVVRLAEENGLETLSDNAFLQSGFDAIWEVGNSAPPSISLLGDAFSEAIAQRTASDIADGQARLMLASENQLILLRRLSEGNADGAVIAFQLNDDWLWGPRELLPFSSEFCIFNESGSRLHCTADIDSSIHASLIASDSENRGSIYSKWQHRGEAHDAILWQLFLHGAYRSDALDIIAIRPRTFAVESGTGYLRIFLPALILVGILVSLLSKTVIDRSLGPLRKVTLAAQKIAGGKLDCRVKVKTGDEFEELGDAFNFMANRIGHQISTLEAMSGIDRLILTGSKLDEVSHDVVAHLIELMGCESAGVIARDSEAPDVGTLISAHDGEVTSERIELHSLNGSKWLQPCRLDLSDAGSETVPFVKKFPVYGQEYIVVLPVLLNDKLKGALLLGFDRRLDMQQSDLRRCTELASRFAVALTSVEREEALYQQAHFDVLTGLPNRQLLKDRLEQSLANARIDESRGAILFLDLDRFKEINDVFGHSIGDEILKQASVRIKAVVREQDTVARLGGDEFVVVLASVRNNNIVLSTAKRLLDKLSEAFTVSGTDHYLSASIGITMFPGDGATVETLLKNADAAMYRAKDAGRGRFEFFSKQLNAESRRKIGIERDLRVATQRGDLELHYQPQNKISSGGISGAEALLRWSHPKLGPISPAEFIPLAEESDLIVEIGAWVLERACADLAVLLKKGLHPGSLSINVSGRQLADTRFTQAVLDPIRRHGIHPGYIQLEITETVVAQNRDRAIAILTSLRSEGVRVAIDDFGTGYSSLSYLQHLPFDVIKIDKSFVDEIGTSEAADNICRTIIKMAELLGKKSIAEGVEEQTQLEFLRANGCDFVQGYLYSKPLPEQEFLDFVEKQELHTQRRRALEIL